MATTALTGKIIRSGSIPTTALGGGVVSSSTQIVESLPTGTLSSSAQFNALSNTTASYASLAATASYIAGAASDWGSLANKPVGIVSSSAQYPGWVTASSQINVNSTTGIATLATTGSNTFTGNQVLVSSSITASAFVVDGGISTQFLKADGTVDNSVYITADGVPSLPAYTVSSSTQIVESLPIGTVSSSAQYPGWVTSSSQIDYNSITNKLSGVVSASAQVSPLLPAGTVSSSNQVQLNAITGTTFSNASFIFPIDVSVVGTLTARQITTQYVSSSVIYESGSSKFGDSADDVMSVTGSIVVLGGTISGSLALPAGTVSSSGQVDYNSITNKLSGVVSASAQVTTLLPTGTISSSAQTTANLPSGVFSSSAQLPSGTVSSSGQVSYTGISSIPSGIVSSSTQVTPLLPTGTVSASAQVSYTELSSIPSNIISSSAQLPSGTVSSSGQVSYTGLTSIPAGIISSSAQVTPLLPAGTVSSSGQVDYNSITNKLSNVVSSSAQVATLLPASTVSSSAQVTAFLPTGLVSSSVQINTGSFSGSITSASYAPLQQYLTPTTETFTGNGVLQNFTLSQVYTPAAIFVTVGGISMLNNDDYTLAGNILSFTPAPVSQSSIVVRGLVNVTTNATGSFSGSFAGVFTGNVTSASYASTYAVGKAIAFSLIF